MSNAEREANWAAWSEWKARCALHRCADAVRARLQRFADSRFRAVWQRCAGARAGMTPEPGVSPADAWHLFESHLVVRQTQAGKSYKDWLFARLEGSRGDPASVIEGGASLIVRDVVREHLRREYSPAATVSLQAPMGSGGGSLSLEDLLPGVVDVAGDVQRREFMEMAVRHARTILARATRAQRVALLARELGLPLHAPEVEAAARCRKSALSAGYHRLLKLLAEEMKLAYPEEDPETVVAITLLTLEALKKETISWGSAENGCPEIFRMCAGVRRQECRHAEDAQPERATAAQVFAGAGAYT